MKLRIALILLAAAPLAAENAVDPYQAALERYPGQLAQVRLALLYPVLAPEAESPRSTDPAARLDAFLADTVPVLKNVRGLSAYLREGARDPLAVGDSVDRWGEAWTRLDEELSRLTGLIADGQDLMRGPAPPPTRFAASKWGYAPLEDGPEFDTAEGQRLHRAAVLSAYASNLREYLIRRSAAPAR